jgi:hypothetical protein
MESCSKASNKGEINKTPCFAGLNTTVLPIIKAGINSANVSFQG